MLKAALVAVVLLAATAADASAADRSDYDGVYVGHAVDTSICPEAPREFALIVQDGHARLLYGLHDGFMLEGRVTNSGAVEMVGVNQSARITFQGQVQGDRITGTSIPDAKVKCVVTWDFARRQQ